MSVGDLIDSRKLFYALLESDERLVAAVTNLVGNETVIDIYGPPGIPPEWTIRNAIMFIGSGGPGEDKVPIGRESFDVYCYAKSAPEATALYLHVRRVLHRKKNARLVIDGETYIFEYAQLMGGPADRTEPEEGWNFVYCSFFVQFVENIVP